MNKMIWFVNANEAKALPILLRHSPEAILEDGTYVVKAAAVEVLRHADIRFEEPDPDVESNGVIETSPGEGA